MIEKLLFGFWEILRPNKAEECSTPPAERMSLQRKTKKGRVMLCNNFSICFPCKHSEHLFRQHKKTCTGKFSCRLANIKILPMVFLDED
jgi:hypothetical protein